MNIKNSPKIKLFNIIPHKDSTIDYYYYHYYHYFHCSYRTSKTSHFKSHLYAKHRNEFNIFLHTAVNNSKHEDKLNYEYNDSNKT